MTRPPFSRINAEAASRLMDGSVPVITKVMPSRGVDPFSTRDSSSRRTPCPRSLSISLRLRECPKNETTSRAISGPMPAISWSASADAVLSAAIDGWWLASVWATVLPTPRMPKPVSTRHSGRVLVSAMAATRLSARLSAKPSSATRASVQAHRDRPRRRPAPPPPTARPAWCPGPRCPSRPGRPSARCAG